MKTDFKIGNSKLLSSKHFLNMNGFLTLTYRCNLNCVYCYCSGSEDEKKELSAAEWISILNQLHNEGCAWITFTGGEPLLRGDFLEIYRYAHKKGFLIGIFTNGLLLNNEIIDFLKKNKPFIIEITLNSLTESVYEKITNSQGTFNNIIKIIHKLVEKKIPLFLKCNGLIQNKDEILNIKRFAERLLGKGRFKFDPFIASRINGDTTPCSYRLSADEILEIECKDKEMFQQRRREYLTFKLQRPKRFLYQCSLGQDFFISPDGQLQFCSLIDKYSCNIIQEGFKKAFYSDLPAMLSGIFTTNSKCKTCTIRKFCFFCPAVSFLETGSFDGPIEYCCRLTKAKLKKMRRVGSSTLNISHFK